MSDLKGFAQRLRDLGINGMFSVAESYDSHLPWEVIGYGDPKRKWDIARCKHLSTAQLLCDLLNAADCADDP